MKKLTARRASGGWFSNLVAEAKEGKLETRPEQFVAPETLLSQNARPRPPAAGVSPIQRSGPPLAKPRVKQPTRKRNAKTQRAGSETSASRSDYATVGKRRAARA